jgi:hypothetical protein
MNDTNSAPLHLVASNGPTEDNTPACAGEETRLGRWRARGQDLAFVTVKASLFLGSSWLMAFGLPLLLFLAISGGDLDQLFWQLDNLASRWTAADAARKLAFSQMLQLGLIGSATLIAIWRMPRFLAEVAPVPAQSEHGR